MKAGRSTLRTKVIKGNIYLLTKKKLQILVLLTMKNNIYIYIEKKN